ncbi:hypothetical protein C8J57DRAFT_1525636 [Mycena rebaudengoi]|nr:hypothetical protein C8J57DRAFT_1525636 [Mycena rebaudengoi]
MLFKCSRSTIAAPAPYFPSVHMVTVLVVVFALHAIDHQNRGAAQPASETILGNDVDRLSVRHGRAVVYRHLLCAHFLGARLSLLQTARSNSPNSRWPQKRSSSAKARARSASSASATPPIAPVPPTASVSSPPRFRGARISQKSNSVTMSVTPRVSAVSVARLYPHSIYSTPPCRPHTPSESSAEAAQSVVLLPTPLKVLAVVGRAESGSLINADSTRSRDASNRAFDVG